ncbi:MAG: radical SAM family heme chaperone HemW [Elusimicrobia bacterium]|nr:radical SAM family heme chaperone HemW [Elusimicrobiota bacterium]
MSGYYIHIPFCKSRCYYCDFTSYANKSFQINSYLDALAAELLIRQSKLCSYKTTKPLHFEIPIHKFKKFNTPLPSTLPVRRRRSGGYPLPFFDTLYIGGGTPSFLSLKQIHRLLEAINLYLGPLKKFKEVTFEANPDSLSMEKIKALKNYGINRMSIGLQTTNDKLLNTLGRKTAVSDFTKAYSNLKSAGFKNINIDIICGIPGQTLQDLNQTLLHIIKLKSAHISIYGLEIHKGTVFFKKKIKSDGDMAFKMYEMARKTLNKAGYEHYEISNFARKGYQSKHNMNYWQNGEYMGFGCSAASYLNGTRSKNTKNLAAYINSKPSLNDWPPLEYSETLSGKEKLGEQIILGLRTAKGIVLSKHIFIEFKDSVEKLLKLGLVEVTPPPAYRLKGDLKIQKSRYTGQAGGGVKAGRLKIKPKYFYISNRIFAEFVI